MHGHVVVAGLGTVGCRIVRLLDELGIKVVVIERSADTRFATGVPSGVPVLVGDAALPENLDRASSPALAASWLSPTTTSPTSAPPATHDDGIPRCAQSFGCSTRSSPVGSETPSASTRC
jgi:hypothetical protein